MACRQANRELDWNSLLRRHSGSREFEHWPHGTASRRNAVVSGILASSEPMNIPITILLPTLMRSSLVDIGLRPEQRYRLSRENGAASALLCGSGRPR